MEIDRDLLYGTIKGKSMFPALKPDCDIAVIELLKGATYKLKKGDVILYEARGKRVLHRIIRVKDSLIVVAGDHNITTEIIMHDQVLGIMKAVIRNGVKRDCDGIHEKLYSFLWGRRVLIRRICARWIYKFKHVCQS